MSAVKTTGDVIGDMIAETLRRTRAIAARDPLALMEFADPAVAVDEQEKQDKASADAEALKRGDVSADDIVSKLNAIRAGRSFKDDEIRSNIEKYVGDLSKAEKTALLAYLKGIEQIVSGQVPADSAMEPKDPDPSVKMQKTGSGGDVKKITPTVVKKPSTHSGGAPTSSGDEREDRSPPLPVKVKK